MYSICYLTGAGASGRLLCLGFRWCVALSSTNPVPSPFATEAGGFPNSRGAGFVPSNSQSWAHPDCREPPPRSPAPGRRHCRDGAGSVGLQGSVGWDRVPWIGCHGVGWGAMGCHGYPRAGAGCPCAHSCARERHQQGCARRAVGAREADTTVGSGDVCNNTFAERAQSF